MVNLVASSDCNDIVHLFIAHFYKSDIETFYPFHNLICAISLHQRGNFVITIDLIYEKYSNINDDFLPLAISTFIWLLFSVGKNTSVQSTTNAARRFYVYCLAFLILLPLKPVQICFSQQLDDNLQGCNVHTRKGIQIKLQKL